MYPIGKMLALILISFLFASCSFPKYVDLDGYDASGKYSRILRYRVYFSNIYTPEGIVFLFTPRSQSKSVDTIKIRGNFSKSIKKNRVKTTVAIAGFGTLFKGFRGKFEIWFEKNKEKKFIFEAQVRKHLFLKIDPEKKQIIQLDRKSAMKETFYVDFVKWKMTRN